MLGIHIDVSSLQLRTRFAAIEGLSYEDLKAASTTELDYLRPGNPTGLSLCDGKYSAIGAAPNTNDDAELTIAAAVMIYSPAHKYTNSQTPSIRQKSVRSTVRVMS